MGASSHSYQISSNNQVIETSTQKVWVEEYYASSNDGLSQSSSRNMKIARSDVGQWEAGFSPAHPEGIEYHVSFTAEEQSNLRDTPDITIVQGSKSSSGFKFQITTGDNGGTEDVYIDTPFTIGIDSPVEVVTDAVLVSSGGSVGTPANGDLVSDNFQDGNGNAPFNLQIRNTTGNPIDWIAIVRDVPYATIPSLSTGAYTVSTSGTNPYTHTFTSTSPLGAYSNITITGGTPSPAGIGTANGNPELYIQ